MQAMQTHAEICLNIKQKVLVILLGVGSRKHCVGLHQPDQPPLIVLRYSLIDISSSKEFSVFTTCSVKFAVIPRP